MVSMGLTLSPDDVAAVADRPWRVVLGAVLQFTIMPSLGFAIAQSASLTPPVAAGVVLVACCPGGVASNLVTSLANADVALSVAMTTASTLAAV
jgi:bile acid:Na+ symporter, BASS family